MKGWHKRPGYQSACVSSLRCCASSLLLLAILFVTLSAPLSAQTAVPLSAQTAASDSPSPVPILSGSIGYFNFVAGGQNTIDSQINPVLLLPLGDRWLIEARAGFEGAFQSPPGGGPYSGVVAKNLDYSETGLYRQPLPDGRHGRFLTPFG